jgi:hypothetical protein
VTRSLGLTDVHAGWCAYCCFEGRQTELRNYDEAIEIERDRYTESGIEGELGAMIARTSDLQFGDLSSDVKGCCCGGDERRGAGATWFRLQNVSKTTVDSRLLART